MCCGLRSRSVFLWICWFCMCVCEACYNGMKIFLSCSDVAVCVHEYMRDFMSVCAWMHTHGSTCRLKAHELHAYIHSTWVACIRMHAHTCRRACSIISQVLTSKFFGTYTHSGRCAHRSTCTHACTRSHVHAGMQVYHITTHSHTWALPSHYR